LPRVSSEIRAGIAADMAGLAGSARRAKVREWAETLGVSEKSIYRWAKEDGVCTGRKPRADRGRSVLSDETALKLAETLFNTQRKNGKICMTTKGAIRLLEKNGELAPGTVSVSHANARLRALGLDKRRLNAPDPHVKMRSLYPNHVHQVDASVCLQWYTRKQGRMGFRAVAQQFYDGKIKNFKALVGKPVLHRYVITDHYSGAFWVRYYYSPGERTEDLLDFLWRAWSPKQDPGHSPFCGVPQLLVSDKGSSLRSGACKLLLENLGVEAYLHKKGNPRAKGQVEGAMNIVETQMEANLFEEPAFDVNELNRWADRWCREYNATVIHARHGLPRYQMWSARARDYLRLPPADFETFKLAGLSAPEERTLRRDYSISYGGRTYYVNHKNYIFGDKIEVRHSPFDFPRLVVVNKSRQAPTLKLAPVAVDEAGFPLDAPVWGQEFKSRKHTRTQSAKAKMEKIREEIVEAGGRKAHDYDVPEFEQMQPHRRAETITPREPTPEISYTRVDAMNVIRDKLGGTVLDDETLAYIERAWGDAETVTRAELENVYDSLIGGNAATA